MLGNDYLIERFRLKKSLNQWKLISVALLIFFCATFYLKNESISGAYIARIELKNTLLQDQEINNSLDRIQKDDHIKAVIVSINSPGGSSVAGESLFYTFKNFNKPIIAQIGEIGTSAAYLAAIGTNQVFAYETSLTGSVGAIIQNISLKDLSKKIGVELELFKSSDKKGIPNMFEKLTPQQKEYVQKLINDVNQTFISKVKEVRKLNDNEVKESCDGRVFTGIQAKKLKLIDQVGPEYKSIEWLKNKHPDLGHLPVKDVKLFKPMGEFKKFIDGFSTLTQLANQYYTKVFF